MHTTSFAPTLRFLTNLRRVPHPRVRAYLLRARCRRDLPLFARYYFPHLTELPYSALHRHLFARRAAKTRAPLRRRRGAFDVVLAPRGAAKSTLLATIFPLHAALYGADRYILVLSATRHQARARLAGIRSQLAAAPRLRRHFPRSLARPEVSNEASLVFAGARIDAFSAGAELRGLTHRGRRPSWVILDDVESSARIRSSEYRAGLERWLAEVVENLGDAATNLDLIGTLLHPDALPARLASRPDVTYASFASILSESDADHLWDRWRLIYNNPHDPDRLRTARRFYKYHRAAMDRGARVLWPARESYYDLQCLRARVGRHAFEKEKQNAPIVESTGFFDAEKMRRFDLAPKHTAHTDRDRARLVLDPPLTDAAAVQSRPEIPLNDLLVFGFLDPALGTARPAGARALGFDSTPTGDCAAVATVGLDPEGFLYVLDLWVDRATPSAQVERLFILHEKWNYTLLGVEANAFQALMLQPIEEERRRRRRVGRRSDLPVRPVAHAHPKPSRIAALEPALAAGWLAFARDLSPQAMLQLEDYPLARHDDVPDALAAAVSLARRHLRRPTAHIATVPKTRRPTGF